jgi:D-alanine-D-alanine ligase
MRICLLTTQDLDADPFPADDWPCDPRPFLPEAEWKVVPLVKAESEARVSALVESGEFDLFFNLCDGAADEETPGIEVVQTLERLGVPFTGATSEYYEPTREEMKAACRRAGIATPAHVLARTVDDVERAAEELRFPMFVKHHSSYASVGLSRASRVVSPAGLRRQARKIMSRFGAALIEEFIVGIECTVLVAENPTDSCAPITYVPMQYRFPDGESFKHADMKWVDYDAMACFPVEDPLLAQRLRDASARFFVEIRGASFGRCDIRVDASGEPFMLEINPNCGVYYPSTDPGSADLCLAQDPAGHVGFTRQLVEAALARADGGGMNRRSSFAR